MMNLKFNFLDNEYWWGLDVNIGYKMPITQHDDIVVDLFCLDIPNQFSPFMVSNKGRYVWSEKPFKAIFKQGAITIEGIDEIILKEGYENLKQAYLFACEKNFPFENKIPNELFFSMPQYNTWIELNHNQTQEGVLKYADGIIKNNMPCGILIIDAGWEDYFGAYSFHSGKFPNPKEMITKLHQMGFKVMLWISPNISPDSVNYRNLRYTNCLIKDKNGENAVKKWWDGYSCVLDLTCPDSIKWLDEKLSILQMEFGIDGFKIDAGDPHFYSVEDKVYKSMIPQEQSRAVCEFGMRFNFNEFRTGYKIGGKPLVMRQCDKPHSWDGLNMLIPNAIVQGLLGYSYNCPDMIGGGEYNNFNQNSNNIDEELIVRFAQLSAFMPMMQFSAAPWRILNAENFKIIMKAVNLHIKFGDYILKLAKNSSENGDPILRAMEYEFPNFKCTNTQFMLGENILVCPVLEKGQTKKTVFLPEGIWISDRDEEVEGEIEIDTPLDRIPYFIKQLKGEDKNA